MSFLKKFLIVTAIFIGIGYIAASMINHDKRNALAWIETQHETVLKSEVRVWNIGPFYHFKNARYYRIETDKNVYWFRYMWGRKIEKEVGTDYQVIE